MAIHHGSSAALTDQYAFMASSYCAVLGTKIWLDMVEVDDRLEHYRVNLISRLVTKEQIMAASAPGKGDPELEV